MARPVTADTSIGPSQHTSLRYPVEGYDLRAIKGQTFTLSFWVKSNKTGTYGVGFSDGAYGYTYVSTYTINSANTWEFKTITITHDDNSGTWNYSTGSGLEIYFALASGSNYHTTAGSWQSGWYEATSSQVNFMDSTSNTFYIAAVKLQKGSVATPFVPRPIHIEQALCNRYYETLVPGVYIQLNTSSSDNYLHFPLTVVKRATPSISRSGGSDYGTNITWAAIGLTGIRLTARPSSGVIGALNGSVIADSEL